jgi:hypothetical protein
MHLIRVPRRASRISLLQQAPVEAGGRRSGVLAAALCLLSLGMTPSHCAGASAAAEAAKTAKAANTAYAANAARGGSPPASAGACTATVTAQVVALDVTIAANRLGAGLPNAMIFALAGDVESQPPGVADWTQWKAGKVRLKGYKRPRPLVLRVNRGECLEVEFRNLVAPADAPTSPSPPLQPTTRATSLHVQGLNWATAATDDGSWVGANATSLAQPGDPALRYRLHAPEEGEFLLYSTGDTFTGANGPDGGTLQLGLFGALIVEPETALYYRSQVNHEDLCLASHGHLWKDGKCILPHPDSLPQIDYAARYPGGHPREGLPILSMLDGNRLVHSDLTAIIAGSPHAAGQPGRFPLRLAGTPGFHKVAVSPDRLQPFREFVIIYHEMLLAAQAFPDLYAATQLSFPMETVSDTFAINYGMGGIGSEIIANRFGVGPTADCTDCKYEEFFLSSWPNGDPAMIVDHPADQGCGVPAGVSTDDYTQFTCPPPAAQKKATQAFFPDDPSNVYHAYLQDHTKFRILHGGSDLHHLHHLHAHQWLHSPDTSSSHYLDSQAIGPGSGFTLETVYNGAGNKNLTVGDSIFHCHFYPHFAAGMWGLWRVHDVFEDGTRLDAYPAGKPAPDSRALPDGEIAGGTPTPAVVPLPGRPMAPEPAPVRLVMGKNGKDEVQVCTDHGYKRCVSAVSAEANTAGIKNPGYPFFIPGLAGSRAPHPPLGFALACSLSGEPCDHWHAACGAAAGTCEALDGGLPRHVVEPGGTSVAAKLNPLDFSKEVTKADALELPENGTAVEKVAMAYHATKEHPTRTPAGAPAEFRTNGKRAEPGAPFADPCIDLAGNVPPGMGLLRYWAVDFQTDTVFNKEGWHYPQQRMTALWGDLFDYLGLRPGGERRPPEPFFFRANSNDCIHYVLANLVPKTYELDDFEVRTPTDVLGQHIHLVKFDVTSSDGAANGWNYEAGTLAPDEVVERIDAFNKGSFQRVGAAPGTAAKPLEPKFIKFFGADPDCANGHGSGDERCQCSLSAQNDVKGGRWCGAQATVERWYVDPTLNDAGEDGTLRTVFTHDHFGPSTHQQIGLYAALVAEPTGSKWHNNENGALLGNRATSQNGVTIKDGGPTSWEAVIAGRTDSSFREFLFAFQDTVLAYRPFPATLAQGTAAAGGAAGGCPAGVACGFCSTDHSVACVTEPSSKLYFHTVCPAVNLPVIIKNSNPASVPLEPSCNYIPGIPANGSLFYASDQLAGASFGKTYGNIWGAAPGSATLASLQKIGWDGTLPIDPSPKGIVVPPNGETAAAKAAAFSAVNKITAANKVATSSGDLDVTEAQVLGSQGTPAQPELITLNAATQGFSVNYRNEPIYPRITSDGGSAAAADLSHVYQSLPRKLPGAQQPPPYRELTPGVRPGDPFTPLLRAYSGDNVQIRMVVGAHQNPHNFHLNDGRWLFEPSNVSSGWRASETMGISEHFEFLMKVPQDLLEPRTTAPSNATPAATEPWTDFLYRPTAAKLGQMSGSWGLLRAYHEHLADLFPVPGGPKLPAAPIGVCPAALMKDDCFHLDAAGKPQGATDGKGHYLRCYGVVATTAQDLFGSATPLTYNTKLGWTGPNAILFLNQDDYVALKAGQPVRGFDPSQGLAEPMVLRAAAGDCIRVTLHNKLTASQLGPGFNSGQLPVAGAAPASRDIFIGSNTSSDVGLHPQLVSYNAAHSDGADVGFNPEQTASPGQAVTYFWYAGAIDPAAAEPHIPVELGAANLLPSDVVNHHPYGMFGSLVIEPEGATWTPDASSNTSATITAGKHHFREFVLESQDDTVVAAGGNRAAGFAAFNLRSEPLNNPNNPTIVPPLNNRYCPANKDGTLNVDCVLSSSSLCGTSTTPDCGMPPGSAPPAGTLPAVPIQTPLFCAKKGDEVRFRLLHPGGAVTNEVFELYGHTFAEEPYVTRKGHCLAPTTHTNLYASQLINPDHNECPDGNLVLGPTTSEWKGSRMGLGPLNHFDVLVASAGGANQVAGDYLYRSFPAIRFGGGIWGIFRVTEGDPTPNVCPTFQPLGAH